MLQIEAIEHDIIVLYDNCALFNHAGSDIVLCAQNLKDQVLSILHPEWAEMKVESSEAQVAEATEDANHMTENSQPERLRYADNIYCILCMYKM